MFSPLHLQRTEPCQYTSERWSHIVAQRLTRPSLRVRPMQDLAQWLEELGMSEYAQRFAENRIDLSVFPT